MKFDWFPTLTRLLRPKRSTRSSGRVRRQWNSLNRYDRLAKLEPLEDRHLLAAFSVVGSALQLNLAANETVDITTTGTNYQFQLSTGTWSGIDGGSATGNGLALLNATAAVFASVGIVDTGAGNAVRFNNSSGQGYSSDFTVDLDSNTGDVQIRGASNFGMGSFTASANSITVSAPLSTQGGNLTLAAQDLSIDGLVDAGSGHVNLLPSQAGTPLALQNQIGFARTAGGAGSDSALKTLVDAEGNIYVTGGMTPTKDFMGNNGTVYGGTDAYIAKFNARGEQLWIRIAGGTSSDFVTTISLDNSGHLYVLGGMSNLGTRKDFSGATVPSRNGFSTFVAKLDTDGNQEWFRLAGTRAQSDSTPASMAVDASGNVLVTSTIGTTSGTALDFAGNAVTGYGSGDLFVAKLDTNGVQQWFKITGGSSEETGVRGFDIDSQGNVYVSGGIAPSASLRDFAGASIPGLPAQPDFNDLFIAKISSSGVQEWYKLAGGNNTPDQAYSVKIDASDNIFVSGIYFGHPSNSPRDFTGAPAVGFGSTDYFVAKFAPSGVQQWFKRAGSTTDDFAVSAFPLMTVDAAGNVYFAASINTDVVRAPKDFAGASVTGYGSNDHFVAKLDGNGVQQFIKFAGSTQHDIAPYALTVDASGNVYLGGPIGSDAANSPKDFAGTPFSGYGSFDAYVAKFDAAGVQQWFKSAGNGNGDEVRKVAVDSTGNVYVAGITSSGGGPTLRDFAGNGYPTIGNIDMFAAKFNGSGVQQWFAPLGGPSQDSLDSLLLDDDGNAFLGGWYTGTADFDPGADIANHTTNGGSDAFIWKLTTDGRLNEASGLTLSDTDLNQIAARTLQIGNATTGPITVVDEIALAAATDVVLASGDAVNLTSGSFNTAGGNLMLSPGSAASVHVTKSGNDVSLGNGTLSFAPGAKLSLAIGNASVDAGYDQLNVVGKVNLTGANLTLTGLPVSQPGQSFRLVENDGSDAVVGTFNGLAEGAILTLNGLALRISYVGGSGNDVVLSDVTLQVTTLTPTSTGFVAEFNLPFEASVLNLYDQGGALGVADVALVNSAHDVVRGSIIVDPSAKKLTFIKSGGALLPDQYTVTLLSGSDAFRTPDGVPLAGNFTGNFTIASPAANIITLGVPDFGRGPAQSVNLPADSATGIPITISSPQGISEVDFTLRYDPALLSISAVTPATGINGAATFDIPVPGTLVVTITSATELSSQAGATTLVNVTAAVPNDALYGAKGLLDLTNVHIYDSSTNPQELPTLVDDGLQIAAYFGDANGSQTYNAPDATFAQRIIVGLDSGLVAYQLADPYLIVDISNNGQVQSNDVTQIQRAIVGLATAEIPPHPGLSVTAAAGLDPIVFIPQNVAGHVGDSISVPVEMIVTESTGITLLGADLAIGYDPTKLVLTDMQVGELLIGFGLSANVSTPGVIRLSLSGDVPLSLLHDTAGQVVVLNFTILAGAETASRINLLASSGSLRTAFFDELGRDLTLSPAPTNDDLDGVDGQVLILADGMK